MYHGIYLCQIFWKSNSYIFNGQLCIRPVISLFCSLIQIHQAVEIQLTLQNLLTSVFLTAPLSRDRTLAR